MAMVVNCTAAIERKSQRIDVVVAAAEKYLGLRDFTAFTKCNEAILHNSRRWHAPNIQSQYIH